MRVRYLPALIWSTVMIVGPASGEAWTADDTCNCRCRRNGDWFIAESDNFSVWSHQSEELGRTLAACCEKLRSSIREEWLPAEHTAWTPRCYVILHTDLTGYRREVGQALDVSVGCTTLTADGGRITYRRIDLRSDATDWRENALPHELTHVVLADRFQGQRLPAWFNEGLSIGSESRELRRQRLDILATHRPHLQDLVRQDVLPARVDPNVAYAASYSIVQFLRELGDKEQLLEFGDRLLLEGCDAALAHVYRVEGGAMELETTWREGLSARKQISIADE